MQALLTALSGMGALFNQPQSRRRMILVILVVLMVLMVLVARVCAGIAAAQNFPAKVTLESWQ